MSEYAHPETLVGTDWVQQHKGDASVVLVEVNVETSTYDEGHIPGAIGWNWQTQLCDTLRRDIITAEALQKLLGDAGISNDTTIVLYGDNNNWFAAWALWQLKLYGHTDVRIMNGGRKKWLAEGRELTTAVPQPTPATYTVAGFDEDFRPSFQPLQEAGRREAGGTRISEGPGSRTPKYWPSNSSTPRNSGGRRSGATRRK